MPRWVAMLHIDVGRHRVHVSIRGDGPPLLLLMGIGGNTEMWGPLCDHLPRRRLIAFDVPGNGQSTTSRPPLGMRSMASLASGVLRALDVPQADVLGVSWGGVLAQTLAIHHPRQVRKLVLVSTSCGLGSVPGRPSAVRALLTPRRYSSRRYLERVAPTVYGGRLRAQPHLVRDHAAAIVARPPSLAGYAAQMVAFLGTSTLPLAWRIACPTLIVSGTDDPLIPEINARILQRAIKGSQLYLVRGGGHLMMLDSAYELAPVIMTFLDAPRPPVVIHEPT